jgi:hypothetical protein
VHIAAAIICIVVAGVLASVVIDDWDSVPQWVNGLAVLATIVLVASAVRIYQAGVRRKRQTEGPRTKIVIADVPSASSSDGKAARRD